MLINQRLTLAGICCVILGTIDTETAKDRRRH